MIEHVRRRPALAIMEQLWRSSEKEVTRLETKVEQMKEALQEIADLRYDNKSAAAIAQAVLVLIEDV